MSEETTAMWMSVVAFESEEDAAEDKSGHDQRDHDGGDDESAGADTLGVFAASDEPDIPHRGLRTLGIEIAPFRFLELVRSLSLFVPAKSLGPSR